MKNRHFLVYSIPFLIFAFVIVTRTSKAMQTTAIGTVVNSLPENKVILLTLLISKRYIPYTDLQRIPARSIVSVNFEQLLINVCACGHRSRGTG